MAFSLKDTFGTVKPVIAMVHFPGLPGRPRSRSNDENVFSSHVYP